jgi:hypothetical protein
MAAPVYKYFTVDLLSNKVLAEIPFSGVSYERALKGAGKFDGNIPISDETAPLNLYDNTMPGKTALYILRDDVCVWGGIIWTRSYDVVSKKLSVSGSEFPSYLYHRRAWKTWYNQFTANLVVSAGVISITVNDGMTYDLSQESTVHIIMSDVNFFNYNGYYQLTSASSRDKATNIVTFTASAVSVATPTLASVTMPDGVYPGVTLDVRTNTYDYVRSLINAVSTDFYGTSFNNLIIAPAVSTTLSVTKRGVSNGTATITTNTTPNLIPGQEFTISNVGTAFDGIQIANTVSGNSVSFDSTGVLAYANTTDVNFSVARRGMYTGIAKVVTRDKHLMYAGQSVTLSGLDDPNSPVKKFDGTVKVTSTTDYSFTYDSGTTENISDRDLTSPKITTTALTGKTVTAASANGTAITYTSSNGFVAGQLVSVTGLTPSYFNVIDGLVISANSTSFTVRQVTNAGSSTGTGTANGYAAISGKQTTANVVYLATPYPHGLGANGVSATVNVSGISDSFAITARSLVNNVITVTTETTHKFAAGNQVTVSGIMDTTNINSGSMSIAGGNATFTIKTSIPHGLIVGNTVTVQNVVDTYSVSAYNYYFANSTATFTTSATHNINVGDSITVTSLPYRSVTATQVSVSSNEVSLTVPTGHSIEVNDPIIVSGYGTTKTFTVDKVSKVGTKNPGTSKKESKTVTVKTFARHKLKAGEWITTSWTLLNSGKIGGGYVRVAKVIDTHTFTYNDTIVYTGLSTTNDNPGTFTTSYDYGVNGSFNVGSVTANTVTYHSKYAEDIALRSDTITIKTEDALATSFDSVTAVTSNTFSVTSATYLANQTKTGLAGVATVSNGVFNGMDLAVTSVAGGYNLSYVKSVSSYPNLRVGVSQTQLTGTTTILSQIFNRTATITGVTDSTFTYALSPGQNSTRENARAIPYGLAVSSSGVTGTGISATVYDPNTITYTSAGSGTTNFTPVFGYASGYSHPTVNYGTYGSYTYNSAMYTYDSTAGRYLPTPMFEFSDYGYSATQTIPFNFRGSDVRSIGEELDRYSDVINGFEYRVDCSYDSETGQFKRTFVLLPIFPDSLTEYLSSLPGGVLYLGQAAPPSAFGADKVAFQFPGNISDLTFDESADNSATRFFMVGNIGSIGSDPSQPYAAAAATDLLNPISGKMTKWPLLDDMHTDNNLSSNTLLYNYAKRYLAEARPPDTKINVSVNGSETPTVGTYSPGDWCTLYIDDKFVSQRLANDLEPRTDVLVRKIDSFSVSVPDGVTYPERITLTLIPEWQADQIGK